MTITGRSRVGYGLAAAALFLAMGIAGCGEGDVRSYTDSAGRSCTVDLADISLTATCDVDASTLITCSGGQEAAITVYEDYDFDTMIYTLESCPACVDAASHTSNIGDGCATVECTTDDDCLNQDGTTRPFVCTGGVCLITD